MVPCGLSGDVHRTQRQGCLREAVAILVTALTLSPSFLLLFPSPFTPAAPVSGKLCLRAPFFQGSQRRQCQSSKIEVIVVHSGFFFSTEGNQNRSWEWNYNLHQTGEKPSSQLLPKQQEPFGCTGREWKWLPMSRAPSPERHRLAVRLWAGSGGAASWDQCLGQSLQQSAPHTICPI